jgi:hypothetical protein
MLTKIAEIERLSPSEVLDGYFRQRPDFKKLQRYFSQSAQSTTKKPPEETGTYEKPEDQIVEAPVEPPEEPVAKSSELDEKTVDERNGNSPITTPTALEQTYKSLVHVGELSTEDRKVLLELQKLAESLGEANERLHRWFKAFAADGGGKPEELLAKIYLYMGR